MSITADIDVIEFQTQLRFALGAEDLFGKADDSLELRISSELKEALRKYAASKRMTMSAAAKLLLANGIFGPEHVVSVVAQRVTMDREAARTTDPV
jgi:hypothetical protein